MPRQTNLRSWVRNALVAGMAAAVCLAGFARAVWGASPPSSSFPELTPPKSPQESLASIHVPAGLKVELIAAEPLVADPIAFAWGGDGRLWVVEMGDYPRGIDQPGRGGGRIKILVDENADGRYDRATVFLEGLSYPTGVLPWRKGALVMAAPELFYAEDSDGDGRADRREVLFDHFAEGNPQHRANGLRYGLDNWVYLANGENGGRPRSVKTGVQVDMSGRDLRVRPQTGEIEAAAGESQWGREQDDWGNWYGSNNAEPMYQFVLEEQFLRRNTVLPAPDGRRQVSEQPGQIPIFARSRTLARPNDVHTANRITSASSAIVYRDDFLGPQYAGNAFICEPVHNLIHRERMSTEDGIVMSSRRAEEEARSEFLASEDNWFRPVMVRTGPDGALYIADMYRQSIEHPEWIPPEWQKRLDLRAGHDRGRLYRVVPADRPPRPIPRLDRLDTAGLAALLESPNGPLRDLAQQRLIERGDPASVPLLARIVREGKRATARLQALATLEGLGAIVPAQHEALLAALRDPEPQVRRWGVRVAGAWAARSDAVVQAVIRLAEDPAASVRMQTAYFLGALDGDRGAAALATLLAKDGRNPWIRAAAASSLTAGNLRTTLREVQRQAEAGRTIEPLAIEPLLAMSTAVDPQQGWRATVDWVASTAGSAEEGGEVARFAAVAGMLDGLGRQGRSLAQIVQQGTEEDRQAVGHLAETFQRARLLAANAQAEEGQRRAAIRLLGRGPDQGEEDQERLLAVLAPQESEGIQTAAVAALCGLNDDRVPKRLIAGWPKYAPGLRQQILNGLIARRRWQPILFDSIEAGEISAGEVSANFRRHLNDWGNDAIRERAAALLADTIDANRQKIVEEYSKARELPGDETRGLAVFGKRCAICHRWGDEGHEVGPDLAGLADRTPEALLIAIFDPNRAIESKYTSYTAETQDGLTATGLLVQESAASVTLLGQEGKRQVVLRRDIERLQSGGKSLMPEGLEKEISLSEAADLLRLLTTDNPPLPSKP